MIVEYDTDKNHKNMRLHGVHFKQFPEIYESRIYEELKEVAKQKHSNYPGPKGPGFMVDLRVR